MFGTLSDKLNSMLGIFSVLGIQREGLEIFGSI